MTGHNARVATSRRGVNERRTIYLMELALRDGQQSLPAGRLALEHMEPSCADIDGGGYWTVELDWGDL
jgi:pyruvate/oxaloacetate carboxyltransferase